MPRIPQVDAYIEKAQPFAQPILMHIRETVHAAVPQVEEAIKWRMPFFVHKGIILANMAGFKNHVNFGFWNGNAPTDPQHTGSMRNFDHVTDLKELPPAKELKRMMVEAVRQIDSGERTRSIVRKEDPAKARPEAEVPTAFAAALKKNKAAAANFKAFSPSCRREYCTWIDEAKRDETRDKRIAEAIEWIAEGKQRHWKYQMKMKQKQ
ncbi:YdeI/OmpD-associated family protein [Granulicella cerasi]|uniref:YdeI/OmpD-associated family protein n=1 Tax=Granulicella cerasi TaxID=741063 RepID=A0ABW1ZC53_9BACT|nr:YdeI/OmpD-associated family protein [Granulicella cerasi]